MKTATANKLNEVKTLHNYLSFLQLNFDCEKCKPGRLVKFTLINNLLNQLTILNPIEKEKLKNICLEAESVKDFIFKLQNNFNTNSLLSEKSKENLLNNTEALLKLTGLKEITGITVKDEKEETQKPRLIDKLKSKLKK